MVLRSVAPSMPPTYDGRPWPVAPGHGEADLARAHGAEIRLHREARHHAEAVRIAEMDEGALVVERRGLEHDLVVARAERAVVRPEDDAQVIGVRAATR